MSDYRFDGRVAVVTGAGRGLGRAYALLLAAGGARVVVNDPGYSLVGDGASAGPAEDVVAEIRNAGGEAVACTESVATPEGGRAIVDAALSAFGSIDILIHNAGNVRPGSIRDMSFEDFESVLNVHLRGAFHMVKAAFTPMCDAGFGRIVLTSSIGGLYGNQKVANYAAAKAGVVGLSNVVALEGEEHNVKCNVIVPGAVTRMAEGLDISAYPPMEPDLVAPVVGWLCHDDCTVNGELLVSIAGRVARAYVGETEGIYRSEWTVADVAANIEAIRDNSNPWLLPVVPSAHTDHILKSFEMARRAGESL